VSCLGGMRMSRLDEIKALVLEGRWAGRVFQSDWLNVIEKAERVEELEERVRIFEMKYENTGSIFNRSHQINRIEALQEENNRYKQALEHVRVLAKQDYQTYSDQNSSNYDVIGYCLAENYKEMAELALKEGKHK